MSEAALDRLIAETRAAEAPVSPEFLRALTEQAVEVLVTCDAQRLSPPVPERRGWRTRLAGLADRMAPVLWPAGLAVPVLAGIWLGGWADSQGYLGAGSVAVSNLALDLGYRLPEVSALVGGY